MPLCAMSLDIAGGIVELPMLTRGEASLCTILSDMIGNTVGLPGLTRGEVSLCAILSDMTGGVVGPVCDVGGAAPAGFACGISGGGDGWPSGASWHVGTDDKSAQACVRACANLTVLAKR